MLIFCQRSLKEINFLPYCFTEGNCWYCCQIRGEFYVPGGVFTVLGHWLYWNQKKALDSLSQLYVHNILHAVLVFSWSRNSISKTIVTVVSLGLSPVISHLIFLASAFYTSSWLGLLKANIISHPEEGQMYNLNQHAMLSASFGSSDTWLRTVSSYPWDPALLSKSCSF